MEFNLLGRKIEISEGRKNYMKILADYKEIARKAKQEFNKDYENTFGLTLFSSSYAEKFCNKYSGDALTNFVMRYVKETKKYLLNFGVYDLTDKEIWNTVSVERHGISYLQLRMEDFILEYCSDSTDQEAVSRIKANFESGYFADALDRDILALCDFVTNYIDEKKLAEIEFVYQKDANKAEAIFENLKDDILTDEKAVDILLSIPEDLTDEEFDAEYEKRSSNINASDKNKLAFEMIELDPRKRQYYEYIFKHLPQAKYDIVAIAKYLSIDIAKLIEEDIKNTYRINSIMCEDDAIKMMAALKETMEKFGVSKSQRKDELEKVLKDFDIAARTYENVLYDTRELRAKAENDDKNLKNLYGDASLLDKNSCKEFISQISITDCEDAIKHKHIQLLENRIYALDKEYLQNLLSGVESFSENECNAVREQIKEYDTIEDIKKSFISKIDERLYSIWDEEDFKRFSELYMQTQPDDYNRIQENTGVVKTEGRTKTKELFVEALNSLIAPSVEAAAKYAVAKEGGMFSSLLNIGKKSTYETLTLNGKVMHPAILNAMEKVKAEKSNGLFSKFGFKKNASITAQAPTQQNEGSTKFCSNCGTKINADSKFCSNCGSKN
ncbi:MAG: zinc ribbon domain-containing protein [Oscillospiraceae bacterium]|nr:zinc ribbon domain-containing protein [Oscillospiraceae bacterium]